jgi:hypothetical protein
MSKRHSLILCFTLVIHALCTAQGLRPSVRIKVLPPGQKKQFDLYLLIGQSNMAGRGYPEPEDTTADKRVLCLNKSGEWEEAKEPIHFDKPIAGVGPGLAFGKAMIRNSKNSIGLVPCAVGGSGIQYWEPGAFYPATKTKPYNDAIARVKVAMRHGILKGVIWNQGEADANAEKSAAYAANLKTLIYNLRADLGMPDMPFVAAQLPNFQIYKVDKQGKPATNYDAIKVNAAIAQLKETILNYDFVTSENTQDRGDQLHYNAASARLMGERYASSMKNLLKKAASYKPQ